MEDYPRSLLELEDRFSDDDACRRYLAGLRWPDGFACPRCGGTGSWTTSRGLFVCSTCQFQVSVTAGTIFQGTRAPLRLWFRAIWWVTSQKNGASALGLQRVLGLGSYETAWTWLHKLRRAMVRPGRDRLSGEVEVDEAILGGVEEGGGRRHLGEKKAIVAIAAEVRGKGIGRIRLRRVSDFSAKSLLPFVEDAVVQGSLIVTDGLQTYLGLPKRGYRHERKPLPSKKDAPKLFPRVHRVASLLQRWLLGTHQGAVAHKHLDDYLDEFTFRFNRRASRSRGKLFYRLLQNAMTIPPAPYDDIIAGHPKP